MSEDSDVIFMWYRTNPNEFRSFLSGEEDALNEFSMRNNLTISIIEKNEKNATIVVRDVDDNSSLYDIWYETYTKSGGISLPTRIRKIC